MAAVADSPLLLAPAVQSQHDIVTRLRKWGSASTRKPSGLRRSNRLNSSTSLSPCIAGATNHLPVLIPSCPRFRSYARIVVVDDATDDPLLAAALDALAAQGGSNCCAMLRIKGLYSP